MRLPFTKRRSGLLVPGKPVLAGCNPCERKHKPWYCGLTPKLTLPFSQRRAAACCCSSSGSSSSSSSSSSSWHGLNKCLAGCNSGTTPNYIVVTISGMGGDGYCSLLNGTHELVWNVDCTASPSGCIYHYEDPPLHRISIGLRIHCNISIDATNKINVAASTVPGDNTQWRKYISPPIDCRYDIQGTLTKIKTSTTCTGSGATCEIVGYG